MVVGKLVFISLSVFSSVFMCFFCFSRILLLYGNSRITIHKSYSNVDFLVTLIKFVIKYIRSTI